MKKFYVYRLFDIPEVTLYVGKGSGKRLQAQIKKRNCKGEILEYCATEKQAFYREVELIAELKPTENKNPGGFGGVCGTQGRLDRMEVLFALHGPRKCVAIELLKFDLRGHLSPSEVDRIRQVANGPRC